MALPGFRNHPKFRRLVAMLRMPEPHVLGHVEMMWEVVYESGVAVLGDSLDVELAAQWTGDPGTFCHALLTCGGTTRAGLIDEIEPGVFQVHDLEDHAPSYVESRKRRAEERGREKVCAHCGETFKTGDARSKFCSDTCRKQSWRDAQRTPATQGAEAATQGDGSATDQGRTYVASETQGTQEERSGDASATQETGRPITTRPDHKSTEKEEANASSSSCAELPPETPSAGPPPGPPSPVVTTLPCIGNGPKDWPVTEASLEAWARAYPAVNVRQEVERMRAWLIANPTRRKTFTGMARFANAWLSKAQDHPRPNATPSTSTPNRSFSRASQADAAFLDQLNALEPGA